jgi:hypothetical protein
MSKKPKTLNAILLKTDGSKEPFILEKKDSLETLQRLVGGLIQIVHINGKDVIVNEEGHLLRLPLNPWSPTITAKSVWQGELFAGDLVLIDGKLW